MGYEELPDKRKRFVDAYIGPANCCKTQAARLAGYASPTSEGSRLYREPEVRAAVEERMRELAIPAEEILARLSEQARGNMADFVAVGEDGSFRISLSEAGASGKLRLVKKAGYDQRGRPAIELYDAQSALLALAKRYGLFPDRAEVSGPEGGPITVGHTVGVDEDDVQRVGAILGILVECGALETVSPRSHGEHGEGASGDRVDGSGRSGLGAGGAGAAGIGGAGAATADEVRPAEADAEAGGVPAAPAA